MLINFLEHLYIVGTASSVVIGFLVAFIIFKSSSSFRESSKYLSMILVVLCLSTIANTYLNRFIPNNNISLLSIPEPFQLLFGPLFYLYLVKLNREVMTRTRQILHFAPFILFTLLFVLFILNIYSEFSAELEYGNIIRYVSFIVYNQLWVYYFLCRRLLKKYREKLKQSCSTIDKINQNWIKQSLFALLIGYSGFTIIYALNHGSIYLPINKSLAIIIAGLTYLIVYRTLRQPEIFTSKLPIDTIKAVEHIQSIGQKKYNRSGLENNDLKIRLEKLESYMSKQKPYIAPELDLKSLAEMVEMSPQYLSQIINEGTNLNFYDYINAYRLKEVIHQFHNSTHNKLSILEIAFNAGFNSKATFNRIFKRSFKQTPSEYRKSLHLTQ